jgi:hypothetical protein
MYSGRGQKLLLLSKKDKISSVGNYRLIAVPNNLSEVFECITHDYVSYFPKSKLNFAQHYFDKPKCTVTNLDTFLDFLYLFSLFPKSR